MSTILETMSKDHRLCDDLFARVEQAVARGDWSTADEAFQQFSKTVLNHFSAEETILFTAFETRTGMTTGPTQVMRSEHAQMRDLLNIVAGGLAARDIDAYAGDSETLLIMIQQHNLKEENVLYPMCDQRLAQDSEDMVRHLLQHIKGQCEQTRPGNNEFPLEAT